MRTVASANSYFVTGLNTGTLKYNMKFCYFAGNILILKGDSFVICQGIEIPIVYNTLLNIIYEPLLLFNFVFCTFVLKLRKINISLTKTEFS